MVPASPFRCPNCHEALVKAVRGGFAGWMLRLFSLHTFRCQVCGERFRAEWHRADGARVPDRREYVRVPVQLAVRLVHEGGTAEAKVLNLSLRGCTLDHCSMPVRVGTFCRLQLFLPERALEIQRARVCSAGPTVGLEFIRLARPAKIRLGLYVLSLWRNRQAASSEGRPSAGPTAPA